MLLGDFGAEVIKVERPGSGDDTRAWGPPYAPDGQATYFQALNRNKRSILADLADSADTERVLALATEADVVGAARRRDEAVRELRRLGHRVLRRTRTSKGDPPTAREREIAAIGRSNREIAEQHVLTTRTIETHLRNIYAKLAVRSRVQLSRALQPTADPHAGPTTPPTSRSPRRVCASRVRGATGSCPRGGAAAVDQSEIRPTLKVAGETGHTSGDCPLGRTGNASVG